MRPLFEGKSLFASSGNTERDSRFRGNDASSLLKNAIGTEKKTNGTPAYAGVTVIVERRFQQKQPSCQRKHGSSLFLFSSIHKKSHSGQRGFALISVLVGIMVLALLAGSLIQIRKGLYHTAHDAIRDAEMEMTVQAGINMAILGLTDSRAEKRWRVDGVSMTVTFNDLPVTITVQDENGKIDINAADRDTFVRLFQSFGVPPNSAEKLADSVVTWRGSGASAKIFQSVEDINRVIVSPELFKRLEPALTVYSQRPQIDRQTAPYEALITFSGLTPSMAKEEIRKRMENQYINDPQSVFVRPGVINPLLPLTGRAFTIIATCQKGQMMLSRKKVIRITDDVSRPFLVLMWK